MRNARRSAVALAAVLVLALSGSTWEQDIHGLIKIFGIGYVVTQFAEPLNNFVNTLLDNKGVKVVEQTKVVPVLSLGVGPGT